VLHIDVASRLSIDEHRRTSRHNLMLVGPFNTWQFYTEQYALTLNPAIKFTTPSLRNSGISVL
jgi:hypothetical protein